MSTLVTVNVTVPGQWDNPSNSNWRPVFGPGGPLGSAASYSIAEFTSTDPSKIEVDAQKNLHVKDDVRIKFAFVDNSGGIPAFYPIGIGYWREGAGANGLRQIASLPREDIQMGTDRANPPGSSPDVPYLILHDTRVEKDQQTNDKKAAWKYFLIVQDNWGKIGVIDPDIENDADIVQGT